MYSHFHQKRILPRKDDQYRTEFPSHYYSSSSVYSYAPTSSSDCPEHGRSHRRTKIILALSVTFATLGVLSIAGIAVYLGFLSKNVKTQYEESYLYSTAVSRPANEANDLVQMPNGRSRSDYYPDDPVEITNRLEEPIPVSHNPPVEDPYLKSKDATNRIFYPRNNFSTLGSQYPPVHFPVPTERPFPLIVSLEPQTPPPPINLHSPMLVLSPKRNRSSSPYMPSTKTNEHVIVHFKEAANKGILLTKQNQEPVKEEEDKRRKKPIVVTTLSSTIGSQEPAGETTTPRNMKPIVTKTMIASVSEPDNDHINPVIDTVNREGISSPSSTTQTTTLSVSGPSRPSISEMRPSRPATSSGFIPVSPKHQITPESSDDDLLLNHRIQLTFDRVSPDFYDKKPWTPLLVRPAQFPDKRPRIEDLGSELASSSPAPAPQLHETYYTYDEAEEGFKPMPQEMLDETMKVIGANKDNGPEHELIRDGNENETKEDHLGNSEGKTEYSSQEIPIEHYEEDHRENIPTYTVSIPHISAPINRSSFSQDFLSVLNESKVDKVSSGDSKFDMSELDLGEDEEYEDEGDENEQIESKVYKLDPLNMDMIPPPLLLGPAIQNYPPPTPAPEMLPRNITEDDNSANEERSDTSETGPDSAQIKSTTDFILSTLGNLSLLKMASPGDKVPEEQTDLNETGASPLFPPTRSYVSVHLPLREKPEVAEAEASEKSDEKIFLVTDSENNVRLIDGEGVPLAPDLTSSSSLNKVLSMMMNFEDESQDGVMRVLKDNVRLVVSNQSEGNNASNQAVSNKTREHKSFARDPKIDTQFQDPETQHVPVALLHQTTPTSTSVKPERHLSGAKPWIPTKLTSLTVNRHNSPVYKFVLRKGQTVEDLLKEIFHNYTTKNVAIGQSQNSKVESTHSTEGPLLKNPEPSVLSPTSASSVKTDDTGDFEDTNTSLPPEDAHSTIPSTSTTANPSTTPVDAVFMTSTSIVINESTVGMGLTTPNGTFRCTSNGRLLSAFARCNSIKECPDNSDEKNCKCADYMKSQLLNRKICDGIVDCLDESDEIYCDWCSPGQYICSGSRVCVPREKICDSKRDCPRGDDESNCVKIGSRDYAEELEDISPVYHQSGYLMVRKKGVWGKLCVETFSSVLSHWEIKDLARAVCKAKTFTDFQSVEKVVDADEPSTEPYYELYNGTNDTDSVENSYSSDESTPRSAIGFKVAKCKTRMVVKVACQDLQCGTAPKAFTQAARIVGGSNALPGGWPWQAALYRDGEYQCGATLIAGRWLLSAGHCFYHAQDDYWVARLGTLRRGATILSPYEQVIKITHIFLHPQYKDIGFVNDVSLLRLEKEVKFTDFVRPVCLPGKDTQIKDGRICTVVGWGQLFETGRVFPDTLQEVQLPLISTTECRKRTLFLPLYKLTDEMFCAGFDRGGRDACLGDSGGPLMCPESDGRWSLYGVTSNGYGCARANRPGVYTKTKSYLDWVYEKISQDSSFIYRDKTKPCSGHRCILGECLDSKTLCNGIADCVIDGSDERNCTWS